VTDDSPKGASLEPLVSCDAAFSCLLQLGGQSNQVGAVHSRNVVNGETLSISRLTELAGNLGIKAEHARLDWQRLQAPGFNYPTLALLKDGNVVLLTGRGRDGGAEVAVWDPLNPYEEILFVPREDFERQWTGDALMITTPASNRAAISPSSDFCWLTAAGLELLGKASLKLQNPELLVHKRKEAGTHSTAAPKTTRQSDRAIAPAVRGEIALAQVEIAQGRLPRDPVDAAPLPAPVSPRRMSERRLSPLARFCIAAGVVVAAAGSGTLLLTNSATDPIAAALAPANEVWAVAPNSVRPTGQATPNATVRSGATVPRTGSAPIPARLSASPAVKPDIAAPSDTPAAKPDIVTPSATPPAKPDPDIATPSATPPAKPDIATPSAIPPAKRDAAASSGATGPAAPAPAPNTNTAVSPALMNSSRLSAEEMAVLLDRGDTLLSAGDVTSARLFYQRAADAGGGFAAIRLGETFDPLFLDRVHLIGVRGDPSTASSGIAEPATSAPTAPQRC